MEFDLQKWQATFGYTNHWFDGGFLDAEFVRQQALEYVRSGDHDVEHYKWAAYQHVVSQAGSWSRERLRRFVLLIEADPNEHLYKGAIDELLGSGVPRDWFLEFPEARFLTQTSIRRKLGLETPAPDATSAE